MAGANVTRNDLDYAASQALVDLRQAFRKVDAIQTFLVNHPSDAAEGDLLKAPQSGAGDPTSAPSGFGYTDDEAYLIRRVFQDLYDLKQQAAPIQEMGRKLTGLN